MAKSIKALYEDGVFKPLTKVRLKNRQRVKLTVIERNEPSKSSSNHRPGRRVGVMSHTANRIVGLFKSGLHDLSKNHDKHLYP